MMLVGLGGIIALAVVLNIRDILVSHSVEGTTSLALIVTFVLGALSGSGHVFTATASGIAVTWLLFLKPQFRAFAGGVNTQEIRSALVLGLFGFVIWPLLPNGHLDPWDLFYPREAWVTVLVVACIGFLNYVLLRVYGARGIVLAAILGGSGQFNRDCRRTKLDTSSRRVGRCDNRGCAVDFGSYVYPEPATVGNLCSGSGEVCCSPTLGNVDCCWLVRWAKPFNRGNVRHKAETRISRSTR